MPLVDRIKVNPRAKWRFASVCLAVIVIAIAITRAHAQAPDARRKGHLLSRHFCAECHAVGVQNVRSPHPEAPSFAAIAATPGMTAMALNAFFQTSHRVMPNFILTTDQTNEIIAYILSIKK